MALSYDICEARASSYSSSATLAKGGRPTTVVTSVTKHFRCIVSGGTASDTQVACQPSLPSVGFTAYYSAATGQVLYNAICVSKNVTRNKSNKNLFAITCTYKTEPLDAEVCLGSPVATLPEISPTVTASISGKDRVLYNDFAGEQCMRFDKVKTLFDQPVVTQDPILTLTIQQYESGISYNTMQDRSFIVNSDTYAGDAAGLWRCQMTSAVEQEVQLASGPVTAVKATYQVQKNLSQYTQPNGTVVVTGWDQQVPLVSPKYFIPSIGAGFPTEIRTFADATSGESLVDYINVDGTERTYTEGGSDDRPDYMTFQNYKRGSFSFLQA